MGLEGIGIEKLLLIMLVVMLLFGARRIPELAGSFGKGIREFKRSIRDAGSDEGGRMRAERNARLDAARREIADAPEARAEPQRLMQ